MRTIYLKIATLIFSTTIILFSCKKDSNLNGQLENNNIQKLSSSQSTNPFDSIGIMHNNLLATTDWTDMTNISDLISYMNQNNIYNFTINIDSLSYLGFDINNNEVEINNDVINNLPLSVSAKNYIIDLILNIDSLGLNTNGDFNSVQTYIKSSESDVINNIGTNFSQNEKDAILVFFSVLVRSNEYWNSDNEDVELLRKGKKWNWWRTGICDAFGAIGGALIFKSIEGAVLGAGLCSAGDALMQLIDGSTILGNILRF